MICHRAHRFYTTRAAGPTQRLNLIRRRPSFLNWKLLAFSFAVGATLSYSEFFFEQYAAYTKVGNDPMLAVRAEYKLKNHSLYQQLARKSADGAWSMSRSWEDLNHNVVEKRGPSISTKSEETELNMLENTVSKPGGIIISPVIFHNAEKNETITFVHMGYKLCGYPMIIHGGMIATLLNETFKRNLAMGSTSNFSSKDDFMVENLKIAYLKPSFADQFLVIRTQQERQKDNVFSMQAAIESESGEVLVKGEAIVLETGHALEGWYQSSAKRCIGSLSRAISTLTSSND